MSPVLDKLSGTNVFTVRDLSMSKQTRRQVLPEYSKSKDNKDADLMTVPKEDDERHVTVKRLESGRDWV